VKNPFEFTEKAQRENEEKADREAQKKHRLADVNRKAEEASARMVIVEAEEN